MMQLLYQINYPPFWTQRVWGLDRVPVQSFSCFAAIFLCFTSGVSEVLEGDLFQDDFTMAFYSFGGVNDQCGVTSQAVQEIGMLPLLSCDSGVTAWLKHKQKGSGVSGEVRGRPGDAKATGDYQLGIIHAHKWLLSRFTGLLYLKRDDDI